MELRDKELEQMEEIPVAEETTQEKKDARLAKRLKVFDLTRTACNHLIGEEHTNGHRCVMGIIFMVIGVGVAKVGMIFTYSIVHITTDMFGYLIHGMGSVPFIELLSKYGEVGENSKDSDTKDPKKS